MKSTDISERFSLLRSDILITQRCCEIVSFISDHVEENKQDLQGYHDDEFLKSTIVAHKLSAIVSIHKIFDLDSKAQSISMMLRWVRDNQDKFSLDSLRNRVKEGISKESLEKYMALAYELKKADFKEFEKRKTSLQKQHDTHVKELRNRAYAHREDLDYAATVIKPVKMQTVADLAAQAHGLYEDIWQAYYNGRKPNLEPVAHPRKSRIHAETKRYIDTFQKPDTGNR